MSEQGYVVDDDGRHVRPWVCGVCEAWIAYEVVAGEGAGKVRFEEPAAEAELTDHLAVGELHAQHALLCHEGRCRHFATRMN